MHSDIDPSLEPRIRWKQGDELLSGRPAFFWAAPMLVDTGKEGPPQDEHNDPDVRPVKHQPLN